MHKLDIGSSRRWLAKFGAVAGLCAVVCLSAMCGGQAAPSAASKPATAPTSAPVIGTVVAPAGMYKTDAAGFIPYWVCLEAIEVSRDEAWGKANETDYLGGMEKAAPKDGKFDVPAVGDSITYKGQKHLWKPVACTDGSPVLDCEDIDGATLNALTYMLCVIDLDKAEPNATVTWGTDDGGQLFVNGKECGSFKGGRHCAPDTDVAKNIPLLKGRNVILLKVVNQIGTYYGIVRVVGSDDRPLAGAKIVAPACKDGKPWPIVDTKPQPFDGTFTDYL